MCKLALCLVLFAFFATPLVTGYTLNPHEVLSKGKQWFSYGSKILQQSPLRFGGCPKRGHFGGSKLSLTSGKYYTHAVSGSLHPLYYLNCQSHDVLNVGEDESQITSMFRLPGIPYNFEMVGMSTKEFEDAIKVLYRIPGLGNMKQVFDVVSSIESEAALLWSCIDFKFFNIQTAMAVTKFPKPETSEDHEIMTRLESSMMEVGMDPRSFKKVNHDICH